MSGLVGLPATAGATMSSMTMNGSTSPVPVALTSYSGVSLSFGYDAAYSGGFDPEVRQTVFHFDDDIAVDTTGIAQCPLASIQAQTRATALAACPASVIGGGTGQFNAGAQTAVFDVFNGQPSSGYPTIYLHASVNSDALDFTVPGVLKKSMEGPDIGTDLDFNPWPNAGVALTHMAVTLNNLEPSPGAHLVSARCSDLDRVLNFAVTSGFWAGGSRWASATQSCPPTGQRAKALKKCKKKHSKKARRKCRKRTKLLPI